MQDFIARKIDESGTNSCMPSCSMTDYIFDNSFSESIEVIENCNSTKARGDHFLSDIRNDMNYAKWFRSIFLVSQTILFLIILSMSEKFHLISDLKAHLQGTTESIEIAHSLTAMTGSMLIALAINALSASIGFYLVISSFAWSYPTHSWISFLLLGQGCIGIAVAVFWLFA